MRTHKKRALFTENGFELCTRQENEDEINQIVHETRPKSIERETKWSITIFEDKLTRQRRRRTVFILRASSELRSYIKWVRGCLVRVLFTNNALSERTVNSKFATLHLVPPASFIVRSARALFKG